MKIRTWPFCSRIWILDPHSDLEYIRIWFNQVELITLSSFNYNYVQSFEEKKLPNFKIESTAPFFFKGLIQFCLRAGLRIRLGYIRTWLREKTGSDLDLTP